MLAKEIKNVHRSGRRQPKLGQPDELRAVLSAKPGPCLLQWCRGERFSTWRDPYTSFGMAWHGGVHLTDATTEEPFHLMAEGLSAAETLHGGRLQDVLRRELTEAIGVPRHCGSSFEVEVLTSEPEWAYPYPRFQGCSLSAD